MNRNALKVIAIVTMLIDHIGHYLELTGVAELASIAPIFRFIGRMSMPIFAFLIAEGYKHTSSKLKYAIRLLIFAILSFVPYSLTLGAPFATSPVHDIHFIGFFQQNILFLFASAMFTLVAIDAITSLRWARVPKLLLSAAVVVAACFVVDFFNFEYGFIVMVGIILLAKTTKKAAQLPIALCMCVLAYANFVDFPSLPFIDWLSAACAAASIVFLFLYNGKSTRSKYPQLFYWFYPLHFLALSCLWYFVVLPILS